MPTHLFYHGSSSRVPFRGYREQAGRSDEIDMLFLSRSPNVARRYGTLYSLAVDTGGLPAITVDQWFSGRCPEGSFLISGDRGYDFPVDTLVLREPPANRFVQVADPDELDDGLAIVHDPASPSDPQFEEYIAEHYDGDVSEWERDVERCNPMCA